MKIILKALGVVSMLAAWVYAGNQLHFFGDAPVRVIHSQYITDLSDDRNLVGASHNVFVGKVVRHVSAEDIWALPANQYEVEVLKNIKWSLTGNVTVEEEGGYRDGFLYVIDDDSAVVDKSGKHSANFLSDGKVYVFATRYNEQANRYTVISHQKWKKQINNLSGNDPRINELKKAYINESPLDVDVKAGRDRNSFKKLDKNQKDAIQAP